MDEELGKARRAFIWFWVILVAVLIAAILIAAVDASAAAPTPPRACPAGYRAMPCEPSWGTCARCEPQYLPRPRRR